jgi:hypothetical protein
MDNDLVQRDGRVLRNAGSDAPKSKLVSCQNCVTYPLKPPVNTVIYEDVSTRIGVE